MPVHRTLLMTAAALAWGCAAAHPEVNRRGESPGGADAGIEAPAADAGEPGPTEPPTEPDAGSAPSAPLVPPGPRPLRCGRTYDHEADYLAVTGEASRVMLRHRDNTSLPAYEGGASCADGCMEEVLRLEEGASITGSFAGVATFSAQGALTSEEGAGTLVVEACGVEVGALPAARGALVGAGLREPPEPRVAGADGRLVRVHPARRGRLRRRAGRDHHLRRRARAARGGSAGGRRGRAHLAARAGRLPRCRGTACTPRSAR
ncbi:MAG: hypothetical protein M5U28_06375 [Sandaracinaceae bacterium]|nr:hypothetical protein [Sandaracinaceae bacterium]